MKVKREEQLPSPLLKAAQSINNAQSIFPVSSILTDGHGSKSVAETCSVCNNMLPSESVTLIGVTINGFETRGVVHSKLAKTTSIKCL